MDLLLIVALVLGGLALVGLVFRIAVSILGGLLMLALVVFVLSLIL